MEYDQIAAVRRFSRFYTAQLGLLDEGLLKSDFSLTEARVLYELATREGLTATDLCRGLGLDAGYLSRILRSFDQRGFITRAPSTRDARQMILALTTDGRTAFAPLDQASITQVGAMLDRLGPEAGSRLTGAMRCIEQLMEPPDPGYMLRPPAIGDIGWIIRRQAILYHQEYQWDGTFELLLADIFARMMRDFNPDQDRGWIAERGDEIVGSVYIVRASDTVAKLRLLYVEPSARGLGIGRRLVRECIDFARTTGYRAITLWTNDVLKPARRIYAEFGFTCVHSEPQAAFGQDLISETWERAL